MQICPKCGKETNEQLITQNDKTFCIKCRNAVVNKRCLAYILDYGFCIGITFVISILIGIFMAVLSVSIPEKELGILIQAICLFIFIEKDAFQGRSLGKRCLKLQVVDVNTGTPIGFLQSFLRNLPLLIPVVPLIAAFTLKKEQRLGEGWAKTKVIELT